MKYLLFLIFLNTLLPWFETASPQELQDHYPIHTLSLTLQAPKEEIRLNQLFVPPQFQEFIQKPYQPQYQVKEYNEEYPIQQFQSIKDKYRIKPILPRNQFESSRYTNYKSYRSKPQTSKKVALVKEFQKKKKMGRVHAQLAQPQFQGLQQIKLSPIQLPEPQIKYEDYHLYQRPLKLPTEMQLPSVKVQQQVQPSTSVSHNPEAKFNEQYPVPSDVLQVPSMEPWNPNNDSNLYYQLSSPSLTKTEAPTNFYPKKYNPKAHEKVKPEQQFDILQPTTEAPLPTKQPPENKKTQQKFEKSQNKKQTHPDDKVQKIVQSKPITDNNNNNEPVPEESTNGFSQGFDSDGEIHNTTSLETSNNSAETSKDFHLNKSAPKDRVEFQMHGFDGPLSYKWGFDTGEGRNRHFRYEERDKLGHVKGHYGYYDKRGKLRMVHYNANSKEGFNVEAENFGDAN